MNPPTRTRLVWQVDGLQVADVTFLDQQLRDRSLGYVVSVIHDSMILDVISARLEEVRALLNATANA